MPSEPPLLDIFHPILGQFRGTGPMNKSLAGWEAADGCLLPVCGRSGGEHAHSFAPLPSDDTPQPVRAPASPYFSFG